MKTVQAKFVVNEVTQFKGWYNEKQENGTYKGIETIGNKVKFNVVSSEKPENETFAMYTPTGELTVTILNPKLIGHFQVGKEYIFDIKEA